MGTILEMRRASRWEERLAVSAFERLFGLLFAWLERSRQRRALAALDAHLLKDIGLAPGDAMAESRKPFWRD